MTAISNSNLTLKTLTSLFGVPTRTDSNNRSFTTVASVVARAKVGGTTIPNTTIKWAFNTMEVGGAHTDGKLIEGAEPYWNIYAENSPLEPFLDTTESGSGFPYRINYRLKRNTKTGVTINGTTFTSQSYMYNLSKFCGYDDANVSAPSVRVVRINSENVTVQASAGINTHDWLAKLGGTHYIVGVKVGNASVYGVLDSYNITFPCSGLSLSAGTTVYARLGIGTYAAGEITPIAYFRDVLDSYSYSPTANYPGVSVRVTDTTGALVGGYFVTSSTMLNSSNFSITVSYKSTFAVSPSDGSATIYASYTKTDNTTVTSEVVAYGGYGKNMDITYTGTLDSAAKADSTVNITIKLEGMV